MQSVEMVDNIIYSGINRITFSYHGRGIHDEFTGVDGSELRIINAIKYIQNKSRQTNKKVFVKIGMLYTGKNISEIEEMLDFCELNGLNLFIELIDYNMPIFCDSELVSLDPLNNVSEEQIERDMLLMRKWISDKKSVLLSESAIKFIESYLRKNLLLGYCPSGLTDIYLDCDGQIYTGCWVLPTIGSIRDASLKDIMKSEAYQNNINRMISGKCKGCTCNYIFRSAFLNKT